MNLGTPPPPESQRVTSPPPKCGKCGGDMQEGYVPDAGRSGYDTAIWVAGRPEFGLFGDAKISDKETYAVRTFRCIKCGFLESYTVGSP